MRAILISAVILCGCANANGDNGRLVHGGVTAYTSLPLGVGSSVIDQSIVDEATAWWGEQIGRPVFFPHCGLGEVYVTLGNPAALVRMEWPHFAIGVASILTDTDTGQIRRCIIVIAPRFPRVYTLAALKHELGHCLALDDDIPLPDANSIMTGVLDTDGVVTDRDRAIVLDQFE